MKFKVKIVLGLAIILMLLSVFVFNKTKIKSFSKKTESVSYQNIRMVQYDDSDSGFITKKGEQLDFYSLNLRKLNVPVIDYETSKKIIAFGNGYYFIDLGDSVGFKTNRKDEDLFTFKRFVGQGNGTFVITETKTGRERYHIASINHKFNKDFDKIDILKINNKIYFFGYDYPLGRTYSAFYDSKGNKIFDSDSKEVFGYLLNNLIILNNKKEKVTYSDTEGSYQNKRYIYDLEKQKTLGKYFTDFVFNYSNKTKEKVLLLNSKRNKLTDIDCKTYSLKTGKFYRCSKNEEKGMKKYFIDFDIELNGTRSFNDKTYDIVFKSSQFTGQKGVIAYNYKKNACGIVNLKDKSFEYIIDGKCENAQYKFGINKTNNHYLVIVKYLKGDKKSFVYDLTDYKKIYELEYNNYNIDEYQEYENKWKTVVLIKKDKAGYKTVIYDNNKIVKEIAGKATLYNTSPNIGYDLVYYKSSDLAEYDVYYDVKNKQNLDAISVDNVIYHNESMQVVGTEEKIHLFNFRTGKIIKEFKGKVLKIDSYGISYKDGISLKYFEFKTGDESSYKLKENETEYNDGDNFVGIGRGNFFINNLKEHKAKIINARGKLLKEYKDSMITMTYEFEDFVIVEVENTKNYLKQLVRVE